MEDTHSGPNITPDDHPVAERRRPGRVEYAAPALIALLRAPTAEVDQENREVEEGARPPDDLAPARGILLSVALGTGVWGFIGAVVWLLWHV